MGLSIDRIHFTPDEHALFADRLAQSLEVLAELLARPDFGRGAPSIGAELEMHLIDAAARPAPHNEAVLAALDDARFTLEINRFNLELNASPLPLAGNPFQRMRRELEEALAKVADAARGCDCRVAVVGILPTLRMADLDHTALSDRPRYHALSEALRSLRGQPFEVRLDGLDPLYGRCDDVTLEGANTSFQVHLRVPPDAFARHYNAAQIALGPLVAVSGNSPFFDAHRLWEETRIALFKQAVDTRTEPFERWHRAPRVCFGHGYVRSAHELFAQSVALHVPLLPVLAHEPPRRALETGNVPSLEELRLHHGTVWSWNRAVYDPALGGHLRIEHRALPAGPSIIDMVANAAFAIGLSVGLSDRVDAMLPAFPFEYAQRNLYRAAKQGLEAELLWPTPRAPSPRAVSAQKLVLELLPEAARGLAQAGVAREDFEPLLAIIEARARSGLTGAQAQRRLLAHCERECERPQALAAVLERYLACFASGAPVHSWELPD